MQVSFAQAGTRLAADAVLAQGRLELRQASWSGAAGWIEARGSVHTTKPYALQARGTVSKLDPSRLGDYPSAVLNGAFEASGGLEPLDFGVALDVAASRFRGQPLAAGARARITPERITGVDMAARLGSAQANAHGQFGAAGDVLRWRVDVPDLQVLHDATAGRLHGTGAVSGRWRDPAVEFDLDANASRAAVNSVLSKNHHESDTGRLVQFVQSAPPLPLP